MSRNSPPGIPNNTPCYSVASRRRRRFLNRWIRALATTSGRLKIRIELRRRICRSPYWVNEANQFGLDALCELVLAILDDLDLRDWQTRHNLETLAERAGLTLSRASRGCDRLSWLKLIVTEKAIFNPYDARCACKNIEVTDDFFTALGIQLKQAYRERARLLKAEPEEIIHSWDARLISVRVANWTRKCAAGLARMKAKRDRARELKQDYYASTLA